MRVGVEEPEPAMWVIGEGQKVGVRDVKGGVSDQEVE